MRKTKIYRAWENYLFENGEKPEWVSDSIVRARVIQEAEKKIIEELDVECILSYSKYNLEELVKNLFNLMKNRKEVSDFNLNLEKNLDLENFIDIEKFTTKQILQKMLSVNFSFTYYRKVSK